MPKSRQPQGHVADDSPFHDLIEQAYKVFKRAAPPDDGACDCCMYPDIKADFFNHGQRDMPLHYLHDWYAAAVNPNLSKAIWAYLLPRILDAVASGHDFPALGFEVALSRFPTGDQHQWTQAEWHIIDTYQRMFLDCFERRGQCHLDDIICMFANAKWNVDDLFSQVFAWPTERLVTEFWQDWCAPPIVKPAIWVTAFWADERVPMRYYTDNAFYLRLLDYGCDEKTAPALATKAFALADLIDRHQTS